MGAVEMMKESGESAAMMGEVMAAVTASGDASAVAVMTSIQAIVHSKEQGEDPKEAVVGLLSMYSGNASHVQAAISSMKGDKGDKTSDEGKKRWSGIYDPNGFNYEIKNPL